MTEMTSSDYVVDRIDADGRLHAKGDILSWGKAWPAVIDHQGQSFRFLTQEVMEPGDAGTYHGHALYEPFTPSNPWTDARPAETTPSGPSPLSGLYADA